MSMLALLPTRWDSLQLYNIQHTPAPQYRVSALSAFNSSLNGRHSKPSLTIGKLYDAPSTKPRYVVSRGRPSPDPRSDLNPLWLISGHSPPSGLAIRYGRLLLRYWLMD